MRSLLAAVVSIAYGTTGRTTHGRHHRPTKSVSPSSKQAGGPLPTTLVCVRRLSAAGRRNNCPPLLCQFVFCVRPSVCVCARVCVRVLSKTHFCATPHTQYSNPNPPNASHLSSLSQSLSSSSSINLISRCRRSLVRSFVRSFGVCDVLCRCSFPSLSFLPLQSSPPPTRYTRRTTPSP